MMAQVNLARSPLFRDQGNFAIQFSLEICTANFISNSRNLEVGISLSSVTWSSFLQLTHKKGFCAGVNTYLLSHQSVLIVTTYFTPLHNCVLLSCRNRERLPFQLSDIYSQISTDHLQYLVLIKTGSKLFDFQPFDWLNGAVLGTCNLALSS